MFHLLFQLPPIPTDFSLVPGWLIMPTVLAFLANLFINEFASNDNDQQKSLLKFAVFLVDGLVSYILTRFAPDQIASIEPLWVIFAGVITAYYAPQVVSQIWTGFQLLGIRLMMGRDAFSKAYTITISTKAAAKVSKTSLKATIGLEPKG